MVSSLCLGNDYNRRPREKVSSIFIFGTCSEQNKYMSLACTHTSFNSYRALSLNFQFQFLYSPGATGSHVSHSVPSSSLVSLLDALYNAPNSPHLPQPPQAPACILTPWELFVSPSPQPYVPNPHTGSQTPTLAMISSGMSHPCCFLVFR